MSPFRKYRYLLIQVLALLSSLAFSASSWAQCPAISITSTSTLPSGMTGSAYSSQIAASGQGTITFTLNGGSLPPGLNMGSTGFISGTPTTAGVYNFIVRATDSCPAGPQTIAKPFSITVTSSPSPLCPPISITSTSTLPSGKTGSTYSSQITASGKTPTTFTLAGGVLPPGLRMGSTGLISGTPTTAGNYNFTVQVTDNCSPAPQTTRKGFSLIINQNCPTLSINSTSPLPSRTVVLSYIHQIMATGGQTPITFAITGGSLPPGLSMASMGLISGTPTTAGNYNFTVRVTDNCWPTPQTIAKVFTLEVTPVNFNVSILPSFFNIPIDYTSAQNLTYSFSTTPPVSTTMVSSQGIFRVGSTQISANNVQISANVSTGRGTVSENLTIRPSIMQQALSMGNSIMTYNRLFTNGITTVNTQVEIRITTAAAADFRINRIQLYFQNRQPVITIKRNDPTLKTYAEINYVGSGLLQGYWEVDGNFLSNVIQTIASGTTVTIESPAPPILPTFSSGSHRIRFVVTKPSLNIAFPEIQYYVTAEEPTSAELKKLSPLSLLFPYNNGVISYEPITFLWTTREAGVAIYLLEFSLKDDERPLFSAYTKNPSYRIPDTIVTTFFSPGKTYAWKVKGFDALNNVTSESMRFIFTMGE